MPWYSYLLAPFALIYWGITGLRNFLYDQKVFSSTKGKIPSIVVGNLSVGGTGKTPMVEFLIQELKERKSLAVLSRGYGRKTKGFIQANPESFPWEIGDEPLQIFRKFRGLVPVFACENRVEGIRQIHQTLPEIDWVILDDAFQHRSLLADFYILLTPFQKPFSQDYLLPMGRLREARSGAKRADLVIVTKCPTDTTPQMKSIIRQEVSSYLSAEKPVLFSSISYGSPIPLAENATFSGKVILISGLADDRLFVSYCQENFEVLGIQSFPDHHTYSKEDVEGLVSLARAYRNQNPVFLCTEKDQEKLNPLSKGGFLGEFPIFVLPIAVQMTPEDKQMLVNRILKKFSSL